MTLAQLFGRNLARIREAKGLSQSDLGHQPRIADYEAGRRTPRFTTVEDLVARLHCDPLELFK